jgi:hypothetical protein
MKNKNIYNAFLFAALFGAATSCKKEPISLSDDSSLLTLGSMKQSTSTAQSIMVDFMVDANYVIQQDITYHYNINQAAGYFVQSVSGPVITSGTGAAPAAPSAPAPYSLTTGQLRGQVIESNKCTFFNGGALQGHTYTQTVNLSRGWKYTWTYVVAPTVNSIAPLTAWDSEVTGGDSVVSVSLNAIIAGESVISSKQHPLKYSFGLKDKDGLSRVQDLKIFVDGVELSTANSTLETGVDFNYFGNAGTYGNSSLLQNGDVRTILNTDSFAGNDNGGSNGDDLAYARMQEISVLLKEGQHTIVLTGKVKGNDAVAETPISVTKVINISGGCGL